MKPIVHLTHLLILTQLLLLLPSTAEGGPEWLESLPAETVTHRFYIGHSVPRPSRAEAFREAYQAAVEAAVRENYGYELQVERESFEGAKNTALAQRIKENYRSAELHGFELAEQMFEESIRGLVEAHLLFRYDKHEILREKARLKTVVAMGERKPASEYSAGTPGASGSVRVNTKPSGAAIYLDGEAYGRSDATIRNVSAGLHVLRIDHEAFEPIEEEIVVLAGAEKVLSKRLTPATAQLTVETVPEGAKLTINGRPSGIAPLGPLDLPAGSEISIQAEHFEADPQTQKLTLVRGEHRHLALQLAMKPAFLIVWAMPSNSTVTINDQVVGTTDSRGFKKLAVEPGRIRVAVSNEGYVTSLQELEASGGQSLTLPFVRLEKIDERQLRELREEADSAERTRNPGWHLHAGLGFSGLHVKGVNKAEEFTCCAGLELMLAKRLTNNVGLSLHYLGSFGVPVEAKEGAVAQAPSATNSWALYRSSVHAWGIGIPLSAGGFFLVPTLGVARTLLTYQKREPVIYGTQNKILGERREKLKQNYWGFDLGYRGKPDADGASGYIKVGARRYSPSGSYGATTTFHLTAGFSFGF